MPIVTTMLLFRKIDVLESFVKKFLQVLFAGHAVAPWVGDTWQPDAGILVPQLLPEPAAITNAFAIRRNIACGLTLHG